MESFINKLFTNFNMRDNSFRFKRAFDDENQKV